MSAFVCWSCAQAHPVAVRFCTACQKLQPPPPGRDHFAALELPAALEIQAEQLEQSFKRLSRKLHPDRFATASDRERRYSLEHATALNDAYRTLKGPTRRAEYLLEWLGRPLAEGSGSRRPLEPEFMEWLMEQREALADARLEGDEAGGRERLEQVLARWRQTYAQVLSCATALASADPPARDARLDSLEARVTQLRYLHNILQDHGVSPTV